MEFFADYHSRDGILLLGTHLIEEFNLVQELPILRVLVLHDLFDGLAEGVPIDAPKIGIRLGPD